MEEGIKYDLLAKYFSGEVTSSEQKSVLEWKKDNPKEFDNMRSIWEARNLVDFDSRTAISKVWTQIEKNKPQRSLRIGWMRNVAAAAILLCVLGIGWKTYSYMNTSEAQEEYLTISNREATPKLVNLPDGSLVTLNQNASITHLAKFDSETRAVQLDGEAFFKVFHDPETPFIVDLDGSEVKVLGTSFNISHNDLSTEVLVRTGRVEFSKDGNEIILQPYEKGQYNHKTGTLQKQGDVTLQDMSWMSKTMLYKDRPFRDIVYDIVEIYGTEIEVENTKILDCLYTGRLSDLAVDQIFELIEFALDVEVIKNQNSYIINGNGC